MKHKKYFNLVAVGLLVVGTAGLAGAEPTDHPEKDVYFGTATATRAGRSTPSPSVTRSTVPKTAIALPAARP